ncbi:hypothetical protein LMH87_010552 [Akanthomyces muscarius]|uniref:RTA1 domain protein n=1 Tax=Akanthomyces muscarius TaxID=2231603 RepID=A0A9W8UKL9_AKAMU|nr:hypothetical protein LMH87_010552 [Akanthomyces muscarius]KAJ4154089.1 hypothetical protein LMH87_010552 [Akanthomyces muscarius]
MATSTTDTPTPTTSSTASPSCTTAVPGKYGHVPFDACNSNYNDNPSFEANLAFAALFGASFVAHIVQAIHYKKRFCWVVIMGAAWETAAFSLRAIGAHHQQELQYALWGQLLFLLAPLWINAFAYMTVARMVYFGLPDKKIWGVRAVKLTVVFVWLDIVCFLVQLGGGVLLSNNDDAGLTRIGMKVYTAGIGLQLGFVVIFGTMTAWFWRRMRQVSRGQSMGRLRFLIWSMLAVLVLIMVRIIFRLLEFGPGINASNKLITDETYPLVLDAMPMLLALALLNLVHPGLVLRGPDGEFPRVTRREKKAARQRAKEEKKRQKEARKAGSKSSFVDGDAARLAEDSDGYGVGGGRGGRTSANSWELGAVHERV